MVGVDEIVKGMIGEDVLESGDGILPLDGVEGRRE